MHGESLRRATCVRRSKRAAQFPGRAAWIRFLCRLTVGLGAVLLACGVIFFIAFNWHALPRMAKFALVEATLAAAVIACLWRGPDTIAGMAALSGAALVTGGLLALVGQTYQTGADTFELFAMWALLILPWALAGRQAPLWLIWLALVNLAAQLWFARWGMRAFAGGNANLWTLFLINAAALAGWEMLRAAGAARIRRAMGAAHRRAGERRWRRRLIGVLAVIDAETPRWPAALAWLAWLGAIWMAFRVRRVDVFVLAGALLSVIVVVALFLGKYLYADNSFFSPLLVAAAVIALATGGALTLKRLATEEAVNGRENRLDASLRTPAGCGAKCPLRVSRRRRGTCAR